MKFKNNMALLGILLLILMIVCFIPQDTAYSSTLSRNRLSLSSNAGLKGNIFVIVNSSIYSAINNTLQQYIQDAEITGYNITVVSWSPASGDVTALRTTLQNAYSSLKIHGAVLIGDLPDATYYLIANSSAGYYYNEYFPCDLYLMDLNGSWNFNMTLFPHPAFDSHTGHIAPEIWVARINSKHLTGQNEVELLNKYFIRNHKYKNGSLNRAHRALVYIDDDWASYANEWNTDMQRAYSNTTVYSTNSMTNDTDYESCLAKNYEWIWVFSHCNGTHQGFGSSSAYPNFGSEGFTNYSEIRTIDPQAFFYNLYCCHGANYTMTNNIGLQYLFGNNGLMVVGSTKTGALNWGEEFYTGLGNNQTFGDSFVTWFANSPRGVTDTYASYGTVLLGDPLLTINHDVTIYPPTVSSTTHPDPTLTYNATTASFIWTVPEDLTGIEGYYISFGKSSTTDPVTSGTWTQQTSVTYSNLQNGTYYFHIATKDNAGCISSIVEHIINVNAPTSDSS
ncbi:MAG: hypothetical protein ACFE95_16940, partial [Candidatus Hodarchaeota archaeon]